MFAVPSFFGYNTTFVSTPVATGATGVGETSFTANWNAFAGAEYYLLDVSTSTSFSSFVFQDQVVLAPTTSYVVIGLTASTTYYYRLRASTDPYFDPDAAAFFARVTAAGGALTTTEQNATNQLVLDMKAAGVWTAMKAIYPMVGASAAACAQNLKSSSFTGTFSSGWTFASNGVTPNGTSAYFDTTLNSFTNLTQTSISFGIYYRSNANAVPIEGTYTGDALSISPRGTDTYFSIGSYSAIGVSDSSLGLKAVVRNGSSLKSYINSTQNGTATNSINCPSLSMYLGALNFNGSPSFYSINQEAFAFIGDGLTDTNMSNYYTAIQAFQTTLSRQV